MSEGFHSVFDSFNARSLAAGEVARTFVPSNQFERLCKNSHSIVIGPRGSGKTTLLKMLQPAAIECWPHRDSALYRAQITFAGIFVAADITWSMQLRAVGGVGLDEAVRRSLGVALFTTHVLRCFVITLQQRLGRYSGTVLRPFRRIEFDVNAESRISLELSELWYLPKPVPSFLSLRKALSQRMSDIRVLASRLSHLSLPSSDEEFQRPYLHLDFLSALTAGLDCVGAESGRDDERWALMFDELEIAPQWIRDELFRSLRSRDERLVFKLALSPFADDQILTPTGLSAVAGQDYEQIALWYSDRNESNGFCRSLWSQMMQQREMGRVEPKDVLGNAWFDESQGEASKSNLTGYGPESKWAREFRRLSKKDSSFASYLKKHSIDPERLNEMPDSERAAKVRKIAPIVAFRNYYLEEPSGQSLQPRARSRKTAGLYSGADALFSLTEGNPRWFIGLMTRVLDRGSRSPLHVEPNHQAEEVTAAAERFAATLRTIEVSAGQEKPVLAYVKAIAKYFNRSALRDEFQLDLPGSFKIDSKIPDAIVDALAIALNAGALVYLNAEDGQLLLSSLRDKQFRLSYLLAPLYRFPLRTGKPVSLSSILKLSEGGTGPGQSSLFGGL